jgi:MFS family permease
LALVRLRFATGFGNVAPAFAHRNYRVYVSGNAVGLIGTWLQRVSVGWLAWTLTHSGAWLGIMSMAEFFPVVFLSPLAGVLADRRNQVSVIRTTQIIGGLQASVLAVLVYSGAITIEWLFALTLLLGITNSFAQPSRMALISNLVDRAALPSALASTRSCSIRPASSARRSPVWSSPRPALARPSPSTPRRTRSFLRR